MVTGGGVEGRSVLDLPHILGPLNVPPTIGITIRSCPFGTGPSEKRSPSRASMLYSKVMVGGTGVSASCDMVKILKEVMRRSDLRSCMMVEGLLP